MIDISNLRDVVDKNLEMYVPWDHIRGIISRHDAGEVIRMKLHDVKITKMLFILVAVGLFIWNLKRRAREAREAARLNRPLPASKFSPIEPLVDFNWETTEPLKFRPFKPKYHLTMGLQTLDPADLIPMDKTYKERLALRRSLLEQYHETVVAVNDDSDPRTRAAVSELYTYLMGTYLPCRYPTMFKLHETEYETGKAVMVQNLVTGELWPVEVGKGTATITALETLIKTVDEDFLILLPERSSSIEKKKGDEEEEEERKYILEAYATCYPAGFDTRKKLGHRLATIHDPVPGYKEKLERSMDRFFDKLEVGKCVRRVNWSVTTDAELFSAFGNKIHGGADDELVPLKMEDLDLDQTFVRCERQTLHRLPSSRALVFAFHTYRYPIQDIKDEGLGEDLARAIDGLKEGSVPQIHFYKRGPVWGEAIKKYLRS
ncbi:hypothetical protein Plec18167_005452 [Paecilomyces lecythidis]|uniref:Uncharacterized protein n=1 Tax=Paecilomyces lecythidis TaxID=3004212 RepID=A0ABR3XII2_9EURO